ncbi:MAG: amino acid-binding protein [Syntrophales bacterium LBB04]|nr:amino acid-binding protein [Syntrophales bacterium LBB04]
MKLKQISVAIENSAGRLFEITKALGDAGINLRALNLVDTGEFGILRLLVSDIAKTRRILMEKHMPAKVDEVVAAEIEDRPGRRAEVMKPLQKNKVQVVYMYAFMGFSSDRAVMVSISVITTRPLNLLKHGVNLLTQNLWHAGLMASISLSKLFLTYNCFLICGYGEPLKGLGYCK